MTDKEVPLAISLLIAPDKLTKASNVILSREMGPLRRVMILVVPAAGAIAFSLGAGWLVGVDSFGAGLVGLYGYFGALAGFLLIRTVLGRRSLRLLARSALRSTPVVVRLEDAGLVFEQRAIPWNGVTAVGRWKDTTLVYFSAVDALVVPDRDLPSGLTAEAFATLITSRIVA